MGRLMMMLCLFLSLGLGCLAEPFTGSTVQLDFLADVEPSLVVRMPDGERTHYELWVVFGAAGVMSLGQFVVDSEYAVLDYPAQSTRLGSVFNVNVDPITASGVRFVSEASLEGATELFISIEPNGETDVAPSGVVIMRGLLEAEEPNTLRASLTGQYTTLLGEIKTPIATAAIVIVEDHVRL